MESSVGTHTLLSRITVAAALGITLIDRPIAVVVQTVAEFR
jgi:hypothetical protein